MRPYLQGTTRPLAEIYDVALLDLDGVVYIGTSAVEGAAEALAAARHAGMRLAFVTNNAARPPVAVADHLAALGIPAAANEVVTSAQAAAHYLADRLPAHARVLVVGTTGLEQALRERGLVPVTDANGEVAAVVQGYSPDLTWRLLAEGAVAINRGVPWVATNLDPTIPSPRGRLPGNGSMVAALRLATGVEPVVTGKPDPTMHRESVQRSRAQRPIVVGDRLDTDIEGANAAGCDSLLVLSGVTSAAELLAAPSAWRPTFLGADIGGLLVQHAQPAMIDGGAECGQWQAIRPGSNAGARLVLRRRRDTDRDENAGTAAADHIDALRALCAALWDAARVASDSESDAAGEPAGPIVQVDTAEDGEDSRQAAADVLARLGLDPSGGG